VHDDGLRLVMRVWPAQAEELAELGFAIQRISREPIVWERAEQAGTGTPPRRRTLNRSVPIHG